MALSLDPEIAQALAPMAGAMADATPPAVGDIAARRAMWEPIIGAAGTAQPIPDDVKTSEHHTTADDGARITMRWYTKDGAAPGPAVLFFHGGGYIFGHIDLFDGPVSRYVSASGVPMLSVEYRRAPEHPFPAPLEDAYSALRWLHAPSPSPPTSPAAPSPTASASSHPSEPPPSALTPCPRRGMQALHTGGPPPVARRDGVSRTPARTH